MVPVLLISVLVYCLLVLSVVWKSVWTIIYLMTIQETSVMKLGFNIYTLGIKMIMTPPFQRVFYFALERSLMQGFTFMYFIWCYLPFAVTDFDFQFTERKLHTFYRNCTLFLYNYESEKHQILASWEEIRSS